MIGSCSQSYYFREEASSFYSEVQEETAKALITLSRKVCLQPSRESYLFLAGLINEYVKKKVPFSANNDERGLCYTSSLSKKDFTCFSRVMIMRYAKIAEKINPPNKADIYENLLQNWRTYAKWTEEAQIGNCEGLSLVGLRYAIEQLQIRDIELFTILPGDHAFLVLGRNQDLDDASDFANWGENAVVCDPWMEAVYPSSEIPNRLYDCQGIRKIKGKVFPNLVPFDPKKQILNPTMYADEIHQSYL